MVVIFTVYFILRVNKRVRAGDQNDETGAATSVTSCVTLRH